jgi:phosphatidylinositol alpha-1,6-mannosyltransferase
VTRRFPPSVGGMETLAADVDAALREVADVHLVALRAKSLANLAWFLPLAFLRTARLVLRRRVGLVVCGDAITWATVAPVVKLFGSKSAVMVLGLDLLFPNRFYQRWIRWALPKAETVIAISSATAAAALERGVDADRMLVIQPLVHSDQASPADRAAARAELLRRFSLDERALILTTLGRLVRRKGVSWFIGNVLPQLGADVTYLVAGEGPMLGEIEASIASAGVAEKVRLLGRVDDDMRRLLLRGADVFVMPNVRVPGDMEGFGMVAGEAACSGALVVASRLEGIREAVVDGKTGMLVQPEAPDGFIDALRMLSTDREMLASLAGEFQGEARQHFSGDRMARELQRALGLRSEPYYLDRPGGG